MLAIKCFLFHSYPKNSFLKKSSLDVMFIKVAGAGRGGETLIGCLLYVPKLGIEPLT